MELLGKRLIDITDSDIIRLLENQVPESKQLDYKREIKLNDEKDKRELLYDITSMANSDGGSFIYGIEELKDEKGNNLGIPGKFVSCEIENQDKFFQKIEDIIRSNTQPSLNNISFKTIKVNSFDILVIGVPKALGLPCMVTFEGLNKFYKRRSTGKYVVDVFELNSMFLQNQNLSDKIDSFREERLSKILERKVFPFIKTDGTMLLHLIPLTFNQGQLLDLTSINSDHEIAPINDGSSGGYSHMYTYDGYATFRKSNPVEITQFDQIFRNGIYECYDGNIVYKEKEWDLGLIDAYSLLRNIYRKIFSALKFMKGLKIECPIAICLNLSGINFKSLRIGGTSSGPFHVDNILLPKIVFENYDVDISKSLKPIIDIVFQAAGTNSSPVYNFDKNAFTWD